MAAERFDLPIWESVELLRAAQIGRLCVIDHGFPVALPVNYHVLPNHGGCNVVVRTGPSTIIGRYEGPASLEVDAIDEGANEAWSVLVRGTLRHVTGAHGLPDPGPWLDGRHHWMVLSSSAITGRRFVGRPTVDVFATEWQLRAV